MITIHEYATLLELTGPLDELKELSTRLRVRPPNYWMSQAYKLWCQTKHLPQPRGWDGYNYPLKRKKDRWIAYRGHCEAIVEELGKMGVDVDDSKRRPSPFAGLTEDDLPDGALPGAKFELDVHQRECVVELLRHATGSIRATVSSGKTCIFWTIAAIIKRRFPKARILYVTPTERLVNQVTKEGRKFLPAWDISQFGGGKRDTDGKDAVVCTAASVHANFDELRADGWLKSFLVLLVDECHHLSSATNSKIAENVPAFFRFGASDSLKNEKKEDISKWLTIRGLTGPCRAIIDAHPLIEVGRVATPWIHMIDPPGWDGKYNHLSHTAEPESPAWTLYRGVWEKVTYLGPAMTPVEGVEPVQKLGYHQVTLPDGHETQVESRLTLLRRVYDEAIIRNNERNDLVVQWTKYFIEQGWPTLVVATRTPHILILDGLLRRAGLDVECLNSVHSTKERDDVFAWVTAGPARVLVASTVKEGVSLPELKAGVIADVVCSSDLARQIIGRFIRKKPDGDNHARIAWFVDRLYPSARRGCQELFRELEKLKGYNFYWPCHLPGNPGKLYCAATCD